MQFSSQVIVLVSCANGHRIKSNLNHNSFFYPTVNMWQTVNIISSSMSTIIFFLVRTQYLHTDSVYINSVGYNLYVSHHPHICSYWLINNISNISCRNIYIFTQQFITLAPMAHLLSLSNWKIKFLHSHIAVLYPTNPPPPHTHTHTQCVHAHAHTKNLLKSCIFSKVY
jgi:hypothetical protein